MQTPAVRQRGGDHVEPWSWRIRPSRVPWLTGLIPEEDHAATLLVRATTTRRSVRRSCCSALDPPCGPAAVSPRPRKSWTSGRHGSSSNRPVRTTPRWRRRGTMRCNERTRWCASGYGANRRGNARECSSSQCWERAWEFVHSPLVRAFPVPRNHKRCAIVCLPADRTTHVCPTQMCVRGFSLRVRGVRLLPLCPPSTTFGFPTHNVFATVRVLDDWLLFGIPAIQSVVTTSEAAAGHELSDSYSSPMVTYSSY